MAKYRSEYRYSRPFSSARHTYLVIGGHGAIHFHVTEYDEELRQGSPNIPEFSAGLEIHYRFPPDYLADQAPSHDECWILKCPCWHDGTSLYAEETLLPQWQALRHDPDAMFRILEAEADRRWSQAQ